MFTWEFLLPPPPWGVTPVWGVSRPLLAFFKIIFYVGSFSYTSRAVFIFMGSFSYTSLAGFIFMLGVSLTHPLLASFLSWEFLLHIPSWFIFLWREFLWHIPCWLHFYLGSFSYTSYAGFTFLFGVSLTHPILGLKTKNEVEFLLQIFMLASFLSA